MPDNDNSRSPGSPPVLSLVPPPASADDTPDEVFRVHDPRFPPKPEIEGTKYRFSELDFYYEDQATGKIVFDRNHPCYETARGGLAMAGIDIERIGTVEEFEELTSVRNYGLFILEFIRLKHLHSRPRGLDGKLLRALMIGDDAGFKRLRAIAKRRDALGLRLLIDGKPPQDTRD